jgi:hypothetical protein
MEWHQNVLMKILMAGTMSPQGAKDEPQQSDHEPQ